MADGIAGGPATPAMRRQDNSTFLDNFLHWMWYGKQNGAGLGAVPGQFLSSIDPRSKAGLVNLASMFAGGPKGEDILNSEMPGQFESYSMGKAAVGGHMGHDLAPDAWMEAVRAGHKQQAHDLLFGGTVHAKGVLPPRPTFNEPPKDAAAAIAQKLGISPAKVRAQMEAADKASKNAAQRRIVAKQLYNRGIQPRPNAKSQEILHQWGRYSVQGDKDVGPFGRGGVHPADVNLHQQILARLYAQIAHNHHN